MHSTAQCRDASRARNLDLQVDAVEVEGDTMAWHVGDRLVLTLALPAARVAV